MGVLAQWDSKVLGLNSVIGLGLLGHWDQPHYEDPVSLHIRGVIVTCSKLYIYYILHISEIKHTN